MAATRPAHHLSISAAGPGRVRVLGAAAVAALAAVITLPMLSGAASAATVAVSDLASLQAALGPGCTAGNVVELDADVVAPTASVQASCPGLVLDLRGATRLTLQNIVVAPGAALTVTGAATDTLTVDAAADEKLAGIATTGATLVLRDLRVAAAGGRLGAGIGGAYTSAAGTIVIAGSAQVEVEAAADAQGAAIGGGYLADAGSTTIQDDARVTVTTRTSAGGAGIGGGYAGDGGQIVVRDRAVVVATARSGANGAAIGGGFQGDGGTILFQGGASVTATARAGAKGAAVGGGYQGDGGTVTVGDAARVVATSDVSGNIIGAAIGGGPGGDGADLTINGGSVTASASKEGAPLGPGSPVAGESRQFGTLRVLAGTLALPSGRLRVDNTPGVVEVVVAAGARVVGSRSTPRPASSKAAPTKGFARITGRGEIVNAGSIAFPGEAVRATQVSGNFYRVAFRSRGRTTSVVVLAPSFRAGARRLAARPAGRGFSGWRTRSGGQGKRLTVSTPLPGRASGGKPHVVRVYASFR